MKNLPKTIGPAHASWRGGRRVTRTGYVDVWIGKDDPLISMARNPTSAGNGYAYEHRVVVARALGRALIDDEEVHHINGNRGDNRIENLQLRTRAHGSGVVFQCCECGSANVKAVRLA